jgi:trigger factor
MVQAVKEVSRFERLVTVELTNDDIEAAKAGAARRLAKDLKIPGFRPGKAPRPVIEAAIGAGRLRTEAIEDLIPKRLGDLLNAEQLTPAVTPSLEKVDEVEGGITAEVLVTLWPTLDEVPDYRDRRVELPSPELGEGEVEESLERMRQQFASLDTADRPAVSGDYVSIDLRAVAGTEAVPETTANELLYEVGSGLLIEGIDEKLTGATAGGEFAFDSVLPRGFGERAGKPATFHVKVNEVKARVLPALDDDWVAEVTEFDTVDELRAELAERLAQTKRLATARQFRERALDNLVDEVELDLPDQLIRAEFDDLYHRFAHRLEDSEIAIADYLAATGISEAQFVDDLQEQAKRSLRTRLVLDAVARGEQIQVSREEVQAAVAALARTSEQPEEVVKAFEDSSRILSLAGDILRNKALDAIVANAQPVDSEGNLLDLEVPGEPLEAQLEALEGELVEGEVVEPDLVEAGVVEAEVVSEEA